MTINELIKQVANHQSYVLLYFGVLAALSFLLGLFYQKKTTNGLLDYLYSAVVYLVSVPAMFSFSLLIYSTLMLRTNLLNVNLLVYFLPLLGLFIVYYLISRKTSLTALPGFGKILNLLIMLVVVFMLMFFLSRLHFVVGFFGSIKHLLLIGLVLFVVFSIAVRRFFNNSRP